MDEFKQYRKANHISSEQFKRSIHNVICSEVSKARGCECSANEKLKIDRIAKKLLKVFDTNKNGKLEFQEAVSAFCILCKGSIETKIKYQMLAYSEVLNEKYANIDIDHIHPKDLCIRLKNLRKFMLCVFRLALQSTPEIMLDVDMDKLADATATKCLEFCGVTDKQNGVVYLEQVSRFIETANSFAIYNPPVVKNNDYLKVIGVTKHD